MPISWNEIRNRAIAFSKEWAEVSREDAEAQTFWNEFFAVFGIKRRTVASFEEPVKKISGEWGFIDLIWPGTLIVEHKSRGKSLEKAESQALEYIRSLKDAHRDDEIPRYVIVSDFARIALHDLEENKSIIIELADLYQQVDHFAFIPGYIQHRLDPEDPANIKAAELLGDLHDALEAGGYAGHELERFLVRVLFCLFAEDTNLFERNTFTEYVLNHTNEDGSDLGSQLARLFQVLNTDKPKRQRNLLEELADLPYVNGELFAESLGFADFNRDMRDRLLACCRFDWSRISPAVFGSLFQSVMLPRERRQMGGHYTSERDILKVVRSLFLNDLRAEFEKVKENKNRLQDFHQRIGRLTFFDPACGCGNFLVVTYRELRLLEIEVLKILLKSQQVYDIHTLSQVDVDAMYGIEISEFPARIAEVALWLVDHQMNQRLSEAFGQYFVRLPLRKSAKIVVANALRIDWRDVLPPEKCSYVLGNPPFVGKKEQTKEQKADMKLVFGKLKGLGVLDYVSCWYVKAAEYMGDFNIECAFVSTNSITQGEQVGILWKELIVKYGIVINFAHRTFAWQSEARGKAHVHVVIIGFSKKDRAEKVLFDYQNPKADPTHTRVLRICPYLADAPTVFIYKRSKPVSTVPLMNYGSMANDKKKAEKGLGNLILDAKSRKQLLQETPAIAPFIRPFMGSQEFINNKKRWCLWLADAPAQLMRSSPIVMQRIDAVRKCRSESNRKETRKLALTPALFGEIRQPKAQYLIVPKVSSESRNYLPVGFVKPNVIANGSAFIIPDARLYHFGVLSSAMHVAWMRYTCGRMKSDYQHSAQLVYNNYPWPEAPTDKQKATVEENAQAVLDARAEFPDSNLADLYDPLTMPAKLVRAHAQLDRAVDACYRSSPFETDRQRVEFLFGLYEKITSPLTSGLPERKHRPGKKRT